MTNLGEFVGIFVKIATLVQLLPKANAALISTVFGVQSTVGSFGGDGGSAASASFNNPFSCWQNSLGETYIADTSNYRLRKVASDGSISTVFGNAATTLTGDGGPAASGTGDAVFVVGDSTGKVYFTDTTNLIVRSIDSSEILHTIAGQGSLTDGADNGAPATACKLSAVTVAIDSKGDIYISDAFHPKVMKVTVSTGILTYVAGTGTAPTVDISASNGDGGPATSALISSPMSVFVDTSNHLYFGSVISGHIRRVDLTTGIITNFAGGTGSSGYAGDGGPATAALLQGGGVMVGGDPAGNVYHTAQNYHNIRVIDTSGIIHPFAGISGTVGGYSGDGGPATAARLNSPSQVCAAGNDVYIPDISNNVFRQTNAYSTLTLSSTSPTTSITASPTLMPTSVSQSLPPTASPSTIGSTVAPSTLTFFEPTVLPSRKPSNRPSPRPSAKPSTSSPSVSAAPTAPVTAISFNSSVGLSNVNATSLDQTSVNAVTSAVASTLGVNDTQVNYVSQEVTGSSGAGGRRQLRAGTLYQILVIVNIVASTRDFPDAVNHNASYLYHRLSNTLMDAVKSNTLAETIREIAVTLGAGAITNIGSVNVTVAQYTDISPAIVTEIDLPKALNAGEFVGLVIGIIASFVLLIACCYGVSHYLSNVKSDNTSKDASVSANVVST